MYGNLIDIVIPKKKSFMFVVYENEVSTRTAINNLHDKSTKIDQDSFIFYLFPVNSG